LGALRPRPDAGAQGEAPAGPQGEAAGLLVLDAGPQGLAAPWPAGAGPQGLLAGCPRFAGAQGLVGPHGLRVACASRIGFPVAATAPGAGAVTAMVAASVDRLPARRADLVRFFGMWACPFSRRGR